MSLHANYVAGDRECVSEEETSEYGCFVSKYSLPPGVATNLDMYARSIGFAGFKPARRADAVQTTNAHPYAHLQREIAERLVRLQIAGGLMSPSVELCAGKRQALLRGGVGTYPSFAGADAARFAGASYGEDSRCRCAPPAVCDVCAPEPGTSVIMVDVYLIPVADLVEYCDRWGTKVYSLQILHPSDQLGYLGASEMRVRPLIRSRGAPEYFEYSVPSSLDRDIADDEYVHDRWLSAAEDKFTMRDMWGQVDDVVHPDRPVYTLVELSRKLAVPAGVAFPASWFDNPEYMDKLGEVAAFESIKQYQTLVRTLRGVVPVSELYSASTAGVVYLTGLSRDARLTQTPLATVVIGISDRCVKSTAVTATMNPYQWLWLRVVSLPWKIRAIAGIYALVMLNFALLTCVPFAWMWFASRVFWLFVAVVVLVGGCYVQI